MSKERRDRTRSLRLWRNIYGVLLLFGVLYWRTGAALRSERQHQETIEALRGNDRA